MLLYIAGPLAIAQTMVHCATEMQAPEIVTMFPGRTKKSHSSVTQISEQLNYCVKRSRKQLLLNTSSPDYHHNEQPVIQIIYRLLIDQ